MDEETTSSQPVESTGPSQEAVPETSAVEAVAETSEPEQEPKEVTSESPKEADDDQLTKWAEKKGVLLDSDNAKKAAKMAMESERMARTKARRASELEKQLTGSVDEAAQNVAASTGQDPELLRRLYAIEVKDTVRDFWDQNPDAKSHEKQMIEILKEKPHLAGDLDSLHALAVVRSGGVDAAKSQGKKEALESLAHKQQAAVPTGSATNPGVTPKEKSFADLSIKEMEAKLGFVNR